MTHVVQDPTQGKASRWPPCCGDAAQCHPRCPSSAACAELHPLGTSRQVTQPTPATLLIFSCAQALHSYQLPTNQTGFHSRHLLKESVSPLLNLLLPSSHLSFLLTFPSFSPFLPASASSSSRRPLVSLGLESGWLRRLSRSWRVGICGSWTTSAKACLS